MHIWVLLREMLAAKFISPWMTLIRRHVTKTQVCCFLRIVWIQLVPYRGFGFSGLFASDWFWKHVQSTRLANCKAAWENVVYFGLWLYWYIGMCYLLFYLPQRTLWGWWNSELEILKSSWQGSTQSNDVNWFTFFSEQQTVLATKIRNHL